MNPQELKAAIQQKRMELETAMELKRPHTQVLEMYKELKELQYRLANAELLSASQLSLA